MLNYEKIIAIEMIPKNVISTLLLGSNFDYILFKISIFFAESGMNVWFVSPEAFNKIPDNIIAPEKQILQSITFFYLKDYKDLLLHLNGIHLWHKIPDVIILSNLDTYCNLYSQKYNSLRGALVATTLLDSISVCMKKKQTGYLILTCSVPPENCVDRIQVLHDMYFPHIIRESDSTKISFSDVTDYYLNKKSSRSYLEGELITEK